MTNIENLPVPTTTREELDQYKADLSQISESLTDGATGVDNLRDGIRQWMESSETVDTRNTAAVVDLTSDYVDLVETSKLILAGNHERLRAAGVA